MTFDLWLENWKDEIEQVQAHCKSDLPKDPYSIQDDLNNSSKFFSLGSELLADVEKHLIDCRAQETLHVKGDPKYDGFSAAERKDIVASRISHISRTRDILRATCQALKERLFVLQGQRRMAETEMKLTGSAE